MRKVIDLGTSTFNFPNREPDVTFPKEKLKGEIRVWIEEAIFYNVSTQAVILHKIELDTSELADPIEYLNHVAKTKSHPKRAEIALSFLFEDEFFI